MDLGTNEGDVDLGTNEGVVDLGTNEGVVDLGTNEGDVDLGTGVVLGGVDGDENSVGGLVDIRLVTIVDKDGLILVGYNKQILYVTHLLINHSAVVQIKLF